MVRQVCEVKESIAKELPTQNLSAHSFSEFPCIFSKEYYSSDNKLLKIVDTAYPGAFNSNVISQRLICNFSLALHLNLSGNDTLQSEHNCKFILTNLTISFSI